MRPTFGCVFSSWRRSWTEQRRVGGVQADDHAERHAVLAHRVDEAAAELAVALGAAQRPAHRVDHAVERLLDVPHLLDAERPDLRLRGEAEPVERDPGQVALRPLGEDRDARLQVRAGLEVRELLPVAAAALVAGADAHDAAALDEQRRRRGLGDDRDAELLRALGQPAADLVDRRDVVSVVPHRGRRREAKRAARAQVVDALALDGRDERHVLGEHPGEEIAEGARIDHRAGEQVRAGRLSLLHDGDRHVAQALGQVGARLEELRRADRGGQPGGARADDQDADVDPLVGRVGRLADELVRIERRRKISGLACSGIIPCEPGRARSASGRSRAGRRRPRGRRTRRSGRSDPC